MPTLVVKNLPELLHERLKAHAQQNHRSVTKEVVVLLEQALAVHQRRQPVSLPPPIKLCDGPLTIDQIEAAIEYGRD